jgi:uncharacterized alkaline shock family protein YloU
MPTDDRLYPIIHPASDQEQAEESLEHWRFWVHDSGKIERKRSLWPHGICYILKTTKEFEQARSQLEIKVKVPVPETDGTVEIVFQLELWCDGFGERAEKVLRELGGGPKNYQGPERRFNTWFFNWFDKYVKEQGAKRFLQEFFRVNGKESIAKNLREAAVSATGIILTPRLLLGDVTAFGAISIEGSFNCRLRDCPKNVSFELSVYLDADPKDPYRALQAAMQTEALKKQVLNAVKEWTEKNAGLDEIFDNLPLVRERLLADLSKSLAETARVPKDARLTPSRAELDRLDLPLSLECKGEVENCCFQGSEMIFKTGFTLTLQRKDRSQFHKTALTDAASLQKTAAGAVARLLLEEFARHDTGNFFRSKREFEMAILSSVAANPMANIPGYAAVNLSLSTNLEEKLKEDSLASGPRWYATTAEDNAVRISLKVKVAYSQEARAIWCEGTKEPPKQLRQLMESTIAETLSSISPAHIYLYWDKPLRAAQETERQKLEAAIERAIAGSGLARLLEMEITLHDDEFTREIRKLMKEIFVFKKMDVLPQGMPFQLSFSFQARIVDVAEGGWERLREELPSLEKIREQVGKWFGLTASRLVSAGLQPEDDEDDLSDRVSKNIESTLNLVVRIEGVQKHPTAAEIEYFRTKMDGLVEDITVRARAIQECRLALERNNKDMLDHLTFGDGLTTDEQYIKLADKSKLIQKRKNELEDENSTSQRQLAQIREHIQLLESGNESFPDDSGEKVFE